MGNADMKAKWIASFIFAAALCGPAVSAELNEATPAPYTSIPRHHYALPPERHVIEKVNFSSFGLRFLINGHYFRASPSDCPGWVAGDRVALLAGDWHGYCVTAVFHDLTRARSCRVSCDVWGGPY
jgi:hypothetical protein